MKELKKIIENSVYEKISFQDILNQQFCHKKKGWVKMEDIGEERKTALNMAASIIGGRKQQQIKNSLMWKNPQHWGLKRIFFDIRKGKVTCVFCTAQCETHELNQLRKYLYSI